MKNKNYYIIFGWMINELKLSGNDLICYAIIYGFSQDGNSKFTGSLTYLSGMMNCSKTTCKTSLKKLVERRLIDKEEMLINNIKFCKYSNCYGGAESVSGVGQNPSEGGAESDPNNTIYNNKDNREKPKPHKFNFKKALIEAGVKEINAEDWLKHRKKKDASDTQQAFTLFINQVKASNLSANDAVEMCLGYKFRIGAVWVGFNAEWARKIIGDNVAIGKQLQEGLRHATIDDVIKEFGDRYTAEIKLKDNSYVVSKNGIYALRNEKGSRKKDGEYIQGMNNKLIKVVL